MYIARSLEKRLIQRLNRGNKIVLLYGPRQVGKTTLVRHVLGELEYKTLEINADEARYIDVLSSRDLRKLKGLVEGYELLFIDEAQRIPDIGINLKILHDQLPDLRIIATGSSSFELAQEMSEPLTGRVWTYTLYPVSYLELSKFNNRFELRDQLEERLIYGSYPEVFSYRSFEERRRYLQLLTGSYLYKDVLELATVRNANKIRRLLKLLAFQVGSEVSLSELGDNLGMAKDTVNRYLDLLEKAFVLFRLSGFSRNLRKEVSKMDKIYFYDLGVRNILIDNMKNFDSRNDIGALWENFLVAEREKYLSYRQIAASSYYWRTYTGAELDYVEEREGRLLGYEFKYSVKKRVREPESWRKTYENSSFELVNRKNFMNFVM